MSPLPTGKALDAELVDLWARRDTLNQAEWERLYQIVHAVLGNYRPSELSGLPEEKSFYIQDFFLYKVMKLPAGSSRIDHAGALRVFYLRHLKDHLRDAKKIRQHFVQAASDGGEDTENHWLDNLPAEPIEVGRPTDMFEELSEYGITQATVSCSARDFLCRSEAWVPVYLAFHFCPDKDYSETLVSLAARLKISSYHYKASQLGINWAANKAGNQGKRFADTVIGRWVSRDLGIEIQPENTHAILTVFKILCLEALNWRENQEQDTTQ
ncbi:hypothetical protein HW932_02950 [Allochromatium humboldtianum]|uniref:Uncharacterized protein n=1 Tax=Allochromatium humboldtianum TaxID=504901 RepID=A0A850RAF0_9GAMM|nr:hypothetical protein [Allochromatium humboldtianum]NVZ08217.1 hypothetical protein [Allochromatium humboldtianum]